MATSPVHPDARSGPTQEQYGGQAVIEGVMMRDRSSMCVAVRAADGRIALNRQALPGGRGRALVLKVPLLRGMVALVDSLASGVGALLWSAGASGQDEEELTGWQVALSLGLALVLAVGLFMLLPTLIVSGLRAFAAGRPDAGYGTTVVLNLVEGAIRAMILVAYVWAIGRMPDVARVLAYHGAEHRVINASESGAKLSPAGIRHYPVEHPRCGTSFLLYVVFVSVLVFSLFGWPSLWQRLLIRLALLPVVAGISYEWVRLAGRSRSPLVRLLCAPGIWLQRLTTREPDDSQVEVAIAALRGLIGGGEAAEEVVT
ncbi:MAG: DUF1385 domain-containing protein [Bacillota bacterium]|nr:DUF1385 domain-containing protein [Bacillota bacterium]